MSTAELYAQVCLTRTLALVVVYLSRRLAQQLLREARLHAQPGRLEQLGGLLVRRAVAQGAVQGHRQRQHAQALHGLHPTEAEL